MDTNGDSPHRLRLPAQCDRMPLFFHRGAIPLDGKRGRSNGNIKHNGELFKGGKCLGGKAAFVPQANLHL